MIYPSYDLIFNEIPVQLQEIGSGPPQAIVVYQWIDRNRGIAEIMVSISLFNHTHTVYIRVSAEIYECPRAGAHSGQRSALYRGLWSDDGPPKFVSYDSYVLWNPQRIVFFVDARFHEHADLHWFGDVTIGDQFPDQEFAL